MSDSTPSFFNNGPDNVYQTPEERKQVSAKTLNMSRIFGYMGLGLLVTGLTSVLFAYLFGLAISANPNSLTWIYIGTFVASIGTLICSIFAGSLSFTSQRKPTSHSVAIPFFIYAVLIGYMFGLIFLAINDWVPLAITFGTTAALFGTLALIGYFSKGNMSMIGYIGCALIGGALMLSFVNMLFMFLLPGAFTTMYWIVSFAIFAGLMFTTIYDVWQIKTISQHYENTPNLNLFCAFRLYADFIALFIRLLYFVLIFYARNRN